MDSEVLDTINSRTLTQEITHTYRKGVIWSHLRRHLLCCWWWRNQLPLEQGQRQSLLLHCRWSSRDSLRIGHIRASDIPTRRISNCATKGPLQNEHLPPEHRQAWENWHQSPQGWLESKVQTQSRSLHDPVAPDLAIGLTNQPWLRWPFCSWQWRCYAASQRMDSEVCCLILQKPNT